MRGEVAFEHVKFGYEGTDRTIIHDFSAVAKAGTEGCNRRADRCR